MQLNSENIKVNIKKIIKRYGYNNKVDIIDEHQNFIEDYNFFVNKNLKSNPYAIWASLEGIPRLTSILAKSYLYQGDERCWKYFDRDVVFRVKSSFNEQYLDVYKDIVEFSLYIENAEALKEYIDKVVNKISNHVNLTDFQDIYPSTKFAWFLAEKWLNYKPIKIILEKIDNDFGIYSDIVNSWNDLSNLDECYWNSLCEYHLIGLDLNNKQTYKYEEFISSGLIPIELINLIKIRKKLNLDTPIFNHDLFDTPMSKFPVIPTEYDKNKDVKYLFIKDTIKLGKKLDYNTYLSSNNYSKDTHIIY